MYESMLRSYWALAQYQAMENPAEMLSPFEWRVLSEFHSILEPLTKFEFTVQKKNFGAIRMNLTMLKNLELTYCHDKVFDAVNVAAI